MATTEAQKIIVVVVVLLLLDELLQSNNLSYYPDYTLGGPHRAMVKIKIRSYHNSPTTPPHTAWCPSMHHGHTHSRTR